MSELPEQFRDLVDHFRRFWDLTQKLLVQVEEDMKKPLVKLTEAASKIDHLATQQKGRADESFEGVYVAPSAEMLATQKGVQQDVDDLIDIASTNPQEASNFDREIDQSGSEFVKGMEAVSIIEKKVTTILFKLMGALSADDVIRQNLQAIMDCCEHIRKFNHRACHLDLSGPGTLLDSPLRELDRGMREAFRSTRETSIYERHALVTTHTLTCSVIPEMLLVFKKTSRIMGELVLDLEKHFIKTIEDINDEMANLIQSARDGEAHARAKMRNTGEGFRNVEGAKLKESILTEFSKELSEEAVNLLGVLSVGDVCSQKLVVLYKLFNTEDQLVDRSVTSIRSFIFYMEHELEASLQKSRSHFISEDSKQIFDSIFPRKVA